MNKLKRRGYNTLNTMKSVNIIFSIGYEQIALSLVCLAGAR